MTHFLDNGIILAPLIFNIFVCDLFYFLEDTDRASDADYTKPYSAAKNHEYITQKLGNS